MKKRNSFYQSLEYPVIIERMENGIYCASIPLLKGCRGYGETQIQALEELQGVKETLIEMMLSQHKEIPEPTVRLEIPASKFSRMRDKKNLRQFIRNK